MNPHFDKKIRELTDWLISAALVTDDYVSLYGMFHEKLRDAGVPIFRVQAGIPTLHPLSDVTTLTWRSGEPLQLDLLPNGSEETDTWLQSPIKTLVESNQHNLRFGPNAIDEAASRYPIVEELRRDGMTDYAAFAVPFSDRSHAIEERKGLVATYATKQPGGFTDDQIEAIERILPRFCLVAKLANRDRLFQNVLDAYLGQDAGARVRAGQIALGTGALIDAVIWFSDLRSSTKLAEELGHEGFLDILNDYFAALAGAVVANNGVVLRFIGDAALAIFPIADDAFDPLDARRHALAAAKDAVRRAADINQARVNSGRVAFEFGIGLHAGEIMYGNIGIPERVEFSVIGPAANEAARIEGLSKTLGHVVVFSKTITDGIDEGFLDLGAHPMKGSKKTVRLFTFGS